jgi:hypothetical protein
MWLEGSALGVAMRGAGVWTYGVANLLHILGVATLFGSVLVLDLRLLGAFARAPLAAVATPAVPLAATGFVIAALSGSCLIVTNATEYIGNPLLLIKFLGVALGLVNAVALGRMPAWRARGTRELTPADQRQLKWFGGLSLASWLTALACGRLIAYW